MESKKQLTVHVHSTEAELAGFLIDTSDVRMERESDRPTLDLLQDEEAWDGRGSFPEERRRDALCSLRSMKASLFCALE